MQAPLGTEEAWLASRERDQILVCADDEETCRALARRRQVDLDRATIKEFVSDEPKRPPLRLIRGGMRVWNGDPVDEARVTTFDDETEAYSARLVDEARRFPPRRSR